MSVASQAASQQLGRRPVATGRGVPADGQVDDVYIAALAGQRLSSPYRSARPERAERCLVAAGYAATKIQTLWCALSAPKGRLSRVTPRLERFAHSLLAPGADGRCASSCARAWSSRPGRARVLARASFNYSIFRFVARAYCFRTVGQERLELSTPRLSSVCSNQLSYWPPDTDAGTYVSRRIGLSRPNSGFCKALGCTRRPSAVRGRLPVRD